jgi:quinol monooxygenase YgiN
LHKDCAAQNFKSEKEHESMTSPDTCCSIVPYFKVHEGQLDRFKALCQEFVARTKSESGCLYYGYSFSGVEAHCREAYRDADGVLAHLANVGPMLPKLLELADLTCFEVHGPAGELEKLKGPLADFKPQYFTVECGFRA